jgi:cellulose synthase/poly-beta-1,6-N-acetylglucosamine synthase-like glycosyltransferase
MSSVTAESPVNPNGIQQRVSGGTYVYVLITPARNEADFLEDTIKSVAAQTIRPAKWVIVSDGSTDGTDEIVKRYTVVHSWIELLRMPERRERDFAGKIHAFNAGLARVKDLKYDLVCSLDADITFGADYFEFLLGKFAENSRLGLAGTPHVENNRTYDFRFASIEHVSGACQLFRRECFEAIGGYVPIKSGGVDLVAVLSARLKGWQTRTFLERTCEHHRKMGSATKNGLAVTMHDGRKDYLLGAHPVWEIFRGAYRFARPPYIIGGACLLWGYFWPMLLREPRTAPQEIVAFRHKEQAQRLRAILRRLCFRSPDPASRNN